MEELIKIAEKIRNDELREKVIELLKNPRPLLMDFKDSIEFEESPASKRRHHSYERGLIIHTLATTKIALALSDILEEMYDVKINRDVIIAASLLHDVFKYITYIQAEDGRFKRSKLGERIDHLSLIIGELYLRKFPLEVIHAVIAHHGKSSPIEPRTIEALLVHMADRTDAEINDEVLFAARDIIKECTGRDLEVLPKGISAFKIIAAKERGGCEEVRKMLGM
ncbi:MAG: HD domain-containing protein [Candidatus Methanomethyliaceae archaeon]|nr:HD domain-containing protein [Candidatus Methanomethyliaceae archaeon]MDW7970996.1 HD domain-containing protein [Nitrososphaerota archaeon]